MKNYVQPSEIDFITDGKSLVSDKIKWYQGTGLGYLNSQRKRAGTIPLSNIS